MSLEYMPDTTPSVQEILSRDQGIRPPRPCTETSRRSFGTEPISVERYISADYQRREYDRMWSRVWQWACNAEDIPNVGDRTVYQIGDRSVLLVRVTPDEIKAYHNVCLHRGRQLVANPGHSDKFVCAFHGWEWNIDGSLAKIPCRWDFPQVRDEDFGLREVRCETWSQFVFINFDRDAAPLSEALEILPEHFKHFPLEDKFTAVYARKVAPANWKVAMEAFLESYHVVVTHPQALEFVADANTEYDVWDRVSRLITLSGVNSPHLGALDDERIYAAAAPFFAAAAPDGVPTRLPHGQTARHAIAGLIRTLMRQMLGVDLSDRSDDEVEDSIQYFVFPNWCPWAGLANALQYKFLPNGDDPHSSIMEVRMMYPVPPGQPRPPAAQVRELGPDEPWASVAELGPFATIFDQDWSNLYYIQKGLKATPETGLHFGEYQESRIRHFHALLEDYLAD